MFVGVLYGEWAVRVLESSVRRAASPTCVSKPLLHDRSRFLQSPPRRQGAVDGDVGVVAGGEGGERVDVSFQMAEDFVGQRVDEPAGIARGLEAQAVLSGARFGEREAAVD